MKNIVWSIEKINELRKQHYERMVNTSENIDAYAQDLADKNGINFYTAKVIVIMLINCRCYTKIRMSKSYIEFLMSPKIADVLNADYRITAYVLGKKSFSTNIAYYVHDLYKHLIY